MFDFNTSDGIVEIDNNLIENRIRQLGLCRKYYLFAGSHEVALNIGYFNTVFGNCKALNINPYDNLIWFLKRVSNTSIQKLDSISPLAFANKQSSQTM